MTIYTTIGTPLGELLLTGEESAAVSGGVVLRSVTFADQSRAPRIGPGWRRARWWSFWSWRSRAPGAPRRPRGRRPGNHPHLPPRPAASPCNPSRRSPSRAASAAR